MNVYRAIAGQIAGAFYGVDEIDLEWKRALSEWDHGEIGLRGVILAFLHARPSNA